MKEKLSEKGVLQKLKKINRTQTFLKTVAKANKTNKQNKKQNYTTLVTMIQWRRANKKKKKIETQTKIRQMSARIVYSKSEEENNIYETKCNRSQHDTMVKHKQDKTVIFKVINVNISVRSCGGKVRK